MIMFLIVILPFYKFELWLYFAASVTLSSYIVVLEYISLQILICDECLSVHVHYSECMCLCLNKKDREMSSSHAQTVAMMFLLKHNYRCSGK